MPLSDNMNRGPGLILTFNPGFSPPGGYFNKYKLYTKNIKQLCDIGLNDCQITNSIPVSVRKLSLQPMLK
jgi:hypothetical protein